MPPLVIALTKLSFEHRQDMANSCGPDRASLIASRVDKGYITESRCYKELMPAPGDIDFEKVVAVRQGQE